LGHHLSIGPDKPDGKILVFIDIGAERGARDIGVDLVGDGNNAVANYLQSDGINRHVRRSRMLIGIHARSSYTPLQ
jgi:hypothetical protein